MLPQNGVLVGPATAGGIVRLTDNRTRLVDRERVAVRPTKRAKVDQLAAVPLERVKGLFVRKRHLTDELTALVDAADAVDERAADRSSVAHLALSVIRPRLPKERMLGRNTRLRVRHRTCVRQTRNLAGLIHVERDCVQTTQRS